MKCSRYILMFFAVSEAWHLWSIQHFANGWNVLGSYQSKLTSESNLIKLLGAYLGP